MGGAYCVVYVCSMSSYIYVDSTTSEPLETLQPSHFKPPVTLSSHYPMKTLEGPQTLSEPPPKGKEPMFIHEWKCVHFLLFKHLQLTSSCHLWSDVLLFMPYTYFLVCGWVGGEGVYLILCFMKSCIWLLTSRFHHI